MEILESGVKNKDGIKVDLKDNKKYFVYPL